MNPIDGDRFYAFLTEQKAKETGAFSKGLNKGLNIARSALKNKEITLPWEVERVVHGRWVTTIYTTISKRHRVISNQKFACSECGYSNGRKKNNYCPNCGCRMDKDGE